MLMAYVKPDLDKSKYDIAREWERKITESLWEMGLNEIKEYGTGKKLPRVRWSGKDPEFTEDEDTGSDILGGALYLSHEPFAFWPV